MTAARFYSSTAGSMELQADITNSSTTLQVDSTVGLPGTTPFTLVIDPGSTEEIVDCTGVAGTSLTVVRGRDGSPAQAHTAGATVRHMATARDFREAQEHIGLTAAHGTASAVVGVTDSQTLTNKNLTSGTNTFPSSLATDAELAAHTGATAAHGATGAVVGTTNNQALTNKDLSSATNTFPSSLATDTELSAHQNATTGVHGVSGNVVGETNTQALSNKNLTAGSNVFPSTLATVSGTETLSGKTLLGSLMIPTIPSSAAATARGLASQTGPLQVWQNSAGTTLASVSASGTIAAPNIPSSGVAGTSTAKAGKRMHWGTYVSADINRSDATGIQTGIAHGCGFTPTVYVVSAVSVAARVVITSVDATNFDIQVIDFAGNANGTTTFTLHVFWGE